MEARVHNWTAALCKKNSTQRTVRNFNIIRAERIHGGTNWLEDATEVSKISLTLRNNVTYCYTGYVETHSN